MNNRDQEQNAEAIFEATMELPTQDRPAAIAAACGSDAALAARVGALHAGARAAGGFLSDPTVDAAPVTEKPGTIIGRYKLLQQIGEGGFGVVYMAEQSMPVKRRVALKVIKLGMDTREVVARFEAERQALAMMDHPNIARVLDAGATESGRPYFVMELVNGIPITAYCDANHLTARQRLELMVPVCRAVQSAHQKGIIHRDLKPSNVMITLHDGKPVPKVIDFGIAKATGTQLTDKTLFTAYHRFIGTPAYMSPEQAEMSGLDIDTRTDVYGLGVLLYELLTGTTPVDPVALKTAAYGEMARIIREFDPSKPSTRLSTMGGTLSAVASARGSDGKKLGQILRGELDWIVMKALEKDRTRRYETASALADDLGRYLEGHAVLAGPVSGAYRLKKTLRRYRVAAGVGAAIAAVLLLGVAGTSIGLVAAVASQRKAHTAEHIAVEKERDAEQQKAIAVSEKQDADAQRIAAQAMGDYLTTDVLDRMSPSVTRDKAFSDSLVKLMLLPALDAVNERFANQPQARIKVQEAMGKLLHDMRRYDLAVAPLEAVWQSDKKQFGDQDPRAIEAMESYARCLAASGSTRQALPLLEQAWHAEQKAHGDEAPETIVALGNYAFCLDREGSHAEAEPLLKRVLEPYRRVKPQWLGPLLASLGICLAEQKKWTEAEPILREGWAWDQANPDPVSGISPNSLVWLNRCLRATGKPLVSVRASENVADPTLGNTDVSILNSNGDEIGAIRLQLRAIDADRKSRPGEPSLLLLNVVTNRLQHLELWADAEPLVRDQLGFYVLHGGSVYFTRETGARPKPEHTGSTRSRSSGEPGPEDLLDTTLKHLNLCLEGQGKPPEILTAKGSRPVGPGASTYADANALMKQQKTRDAEVLYRKAADLDRAAGPDAQLDLAEDLLGLALALPGDTRADEAIATAGESATILRANRHFGDLVLVKVDRRLGELFFADNQLHESIFALKEAVGIDGETEPDVLLWTQDEVNLAKAQEKNNDLSGAEASLYGALERMQRLPRSGRTAKQTQAIVLQLAALLDREKKPDEAAAVRIKAALIPTSRPSPGLIPADVKVTIAHVDNSQATAEFKLNGMPPLVVNSLSTKVKFSIVDGKEDGNDGKLEVLNNGKLATNADDAKACFFFFGDGNRLAADLGKVTDLKQVNTWSWHNAGRAPQAYALYAADGTRAGFDVAPKTGTDPTGCGWKLLADVDTHDQFKNQAGQYGVSIADTNGSLGKFRYLLFVIRPGTPGSVNGNTFYSEINIVPVDAK